MAAVRHLEFSKTRFLTNKSPWAAAVLLLYPDIKFGAKMLTDNILNFRKTDCCVECPASGGC